MDLKGKLRQGMRIFGSDNRDYGTIDRYDDDYVYVGQRRIPTSAFERAENDRPAATGVPHPQPHVRGGSSVIGRPLRRVGL